MRECMLLDGVELRIVDGGHRCGAIREIGRFGLGKSFRGPSRSVDEDSFGAAGDTNPPAPAPVSWLDHIEYFVSAADAAAVIEPTKKSRLQMMERLHPGKFYLECATVSRLVWTFAQEHPVFSGVAAVGSAFYKFAMPYIYKLIPHAWKLFVFALLLSDAVFIAGIFGHSALTVITESGWNNIDVFIAFRSTITQGILGVANVVFALLLRLRERAQHQTATVQKLRLCEAFS